MQRQVVELWNQEKVSVVGKVAVSGECQEYG